MAYESSGPGSAGPALPHAGGKTEGQAGGAPFMFQKGPLREEIGVPSEVCLAESQQLLESLFTQ